MSDDWRTEGRCNSQDPELFFPVGDNDRARAQARAAKAICASCPVNPQCLEWVLGHYPQQGVWAGTDEQERLCLRRNTQRARIAVLRKNAEDARRAA